ncbi:hypothetical protein B7R22_13900 [Subtercola boreus]|uniref:Carbohydrate kinase n=1 Tax=Subtercola boreus TaxID=120213 RepID=A0A3E0VUZ9_9MICO|nr:FGGY family carbohydrate kinase [Subtercola boreus]RFA13183.1 hypothetical protein B7R22_13900 [Subtercola boreus]
MTDDALWIGIDVGTQSVRATVVDGAGTRLAAASSPIRSDRTLRPHGNRHEQDPHQWISSTHTALADAMNQLTPFQRACISGIATCATSGSLTVIDGDGYPVAPGIMYDDARAGALAHEVVAAAPELWKRLGFRIQPTWALPKILWLHRNGLLAVSTELNSPVAGASPNSADTARFVAHQADLVASSLIGRRVASDWSHALKSGYDLLEERWPEVTLTKLGIDPTLLPEIVAPGTVLGETDALLAETTGIREGTPVFAGMTDGCAAQLGAAALGLGDCHTVIGTTMVLKTVSAGLVADDAGAVYSHRSPEEGLWFPGGASNVGAGILTGLFPNENLDELTAATTEYYDAKPVADLPFSYPLPGTGERFPIVEPSAEGFVSAGGVEYPLTEALQQLGKLPTYAAVLVGVACAERLALEQLSGSNEAPAGVLSSSGGGTRNAWWVQLRSDLLGREITVASTADGSTGMAILGAWAAQRSRPDPHTLAEIASHMTHADKIYRPNAERTKELNTVYESFRRSLTRKGWLAG